MIEFTRGEAQWSIKTKAEDGANEGLNDMKRHALPLTLHQDSCHFLALTLP